jgi:hypothetical protein
MSDFNWCHGPECHEKKTVDRVRGTKGNKVLRTRKITLSKYMKENTNWSSNYFCSNSCERDFWSKYGNEIRQIAPRPEALETPIEDPKKERVVSHWNPNHSWTETTITKVQN